MTSWTLASPGLWLTGCGPIWPGAGAEGRGSPCEVLDSPLPGLLYIWGGELISAGFPLVGFGDGMDLGLGPTCGTRWCCWSYSDTKQKIEKLCI